MDQDEEEIVYGDQSANAIATNSAALPQASSTPTPAPPTLVAVPGLSVGETAEADGASKAAVEQQDLEEGEEEEEEEEVEVEVEESDDDIEFVIHRKDGTRPTTPPLPSRYNQVRMVHPRPAPETATTKPAAPNPPNVTTSRPPSRPSSSVPQQPPPAATSKLDLNANPPYNGTPIKSISLDSDSLLPADKPWRKPGADVTDYFNYGFDEFTWTAYCQKQESLREEFDPRKMMEQMMMISGMTGGLGLPGIVDPTAVGVGAMDMSAAALMGFNPNGSGGAPTTSTGGGGAGGGDMGMGVGGMVDPSMYGGGPMGGGGPIGGPMGGGGSMGGGGPMGGGGSMGGGSLGGGGPMGGGGSMGGGGPMGGAGPMGGGGMIPGTGMMAGGGMMGGGGGGMMGGAGPMGGGYDDRGTSAYAMMDPRRGGMPPRGPQQGMGGYGHFEQNMMQQQQHPQQYPQQNTRGGYGAARGGARGGRW